VKGSFLIIPFSVIIHLVIINSTLYMLTPGTFAIFTVMVSLNAAWLLIGVGLSFYSINRKERFIHKFHKFLRHYFVFALSYFTVLSFIKVDFEPKKQLYVLAVLFTLLSTYRWLFFEFRKMYRKGGGNFLNVIVLGKDENLPRLERIFAIPEYGYRYLGYFQNSKSAKTGDKNLGFLEDAFQYILNEQVDEIYCSVGQFSTDELAKLRSFADNNLKKLKLVPDNKGVYSNSMEFELFETVPVLNLRKSPLDKNYAKYGKRIFDIMVSSIMIIFVLSWLVPLLFVLNLLESRGPVIFKQLRHGEKKESFWCYKFRSMAVNSEANSQMCTRHDLRVTRIGKFIRKTSIDELPQFINVFLGDMSIVGPRPHMELHTEDFQQNVDKYLVRHYTKPGITGLAQVSGYRGEIVHKSDIVNRTRMDIFYVEKWSPLLDLRIICRTVVLAIVGDEKAY